MNENMDKCKDVFYLDAQKWFNSKVLEDYIKKLFQKSDKNNEWLQGLYHTYISLAEFLKETKGTSTNFTGFSELLIIMVIKKYLEKEFGHFRSEKFPKSVSKYFKNREITISHETGFSIRNMKRKNKPKPDIVIEKDCKAVCIIQIKTYLSEKSMLQLEKEVKKTVDILDELKRNNMALENSFCAVLIFHENFNPNSGNENKKYIELFEARDDTFLSCYKIIKHEKFLSMKDVLRKICFLLNNNISSKSIM